MLANLLHAVLSHPTDFIKPRLRRAVTPTSKAGLAGGAAGGHVQQFETTGKVSW